MDEKKQAISEYLASIGKKGGSVKSEAKARSSAENGKKGGRPPLSTLQRRQNYQFTTFKQLQNDVSKGVIDGGFAAFILDDFGISDRNQILLAWRSRVEKIGGKSAIFTGNRLDGKDITKRYVFPTNEDKVDSDSEIEWEKESILSEYTGTFGTTSFSEIASAIKTIQKAEIDTKNSKPTYWWEEVDWASD
jgi:hypothetical protein